MTDNNKISFASWNIGGGILGESHQISGVSNINYYCSILFPYSPDILCLQESHSFGNTKPSQTEMLAKKLGYKYFREYPISRSHLDESAYLTLSILSKYKIAEWKTDKFENPQLKSTGPNGQEWNLFDKGWCSCNTQTLFGDVTILNGHWFPLHYFGASHTNIRYLNIIKPMMQDLLLLEKQRPVLAAIDLNYSKIETMLPDLFKNNAYVNALPDKPTTTKGEKQDFILYTNAFTNLHAEIIKTNSDHELCLACLNFEFA